MKFSGFLKIIISSCMIIVVAFFSTSLRADIMSISEIENNPRIEFMNRAEVIDGFLLFKNTDIGIEKLNDFEFYYGFKTKSELDLEYPDYYEALVIQSMPIELNPDLFRAHAYRVNYTLSDLKQKECMEGRFSKCRIKYVNLATLNSEVLTAIHQKNITSFVEIKHDMDDITLANILKLASIPLSKKLDEETLDIKGLSYSLVIADDLKKDTPNLLSILDMSPKYIDLKVEKSGERVYQVGYVSRAGKSSKTIVLNVRLGNGSTMHYDLELKNGPFY